MNPPRPSRKPSPCETTTILRVTTSGMADNDGSSWADDHAMTLQAALGMAVAGDQIWIAVGEYTPTDLAGATPTEEERAVSFQIPAGVLVYGGFEGTEAVFDPTTNDTRSRNAEGELIHVTILSGDLADNDTARPASDATTAVIDAYNNARTENSNTVVRITGANAVLDGLTITAGVRGSTLNSVIVGAGLFAGTGTAGTMLTGCTFTENTSSNSGGGAYFIGTATLTGCAFTDNTATGGSGGGAYFNRVATLTGCTFTNNEANRFGGGAVFFEISATATTTLTGCTFTGNTSTTGNGGGADFFVRAMLTGCTFTNNTANSNGGGANFNTPATLTNCTFTGNTATTNRGGGAKFSSSAATLMGCTFMGNMALGTGTGGRAGNGGGAEFEGIPTLTDCMFMDNTGTFGAGAYFTSGTLTRCSFTDNMATNGGGGIYFEAGSRTLTDCTFTRNTATNNGGGANFGSFSTMIGCTFTGNIATTGTGGGAYFTRGGTLTGCDFMSNTAKSSTSSEGGGAYFKSSTNDTAMLTECDFMGNESGFGGGIRLLVTGTLTDCTFTSNTATSSGGGAHFGNTATLTGCTFMGNMATAGSGGGIYSSTPSVAITVTLMDCDFMDNEASTGGGTYFSDQLITAILTDCTFTENDATTNSGGGSSFFGPATLTDCSFTSNTAHFFGGGVFFFNDTGVVKLTGCAFTSNTANEDGGGARFHGTATLTNCTFTSNTTTASVGGGAYFLRASTLTNNIFANNTATANSGGGMYMVDGGTIINSTIYNNTATNSNGGGIYVAYNRGGSFNLRNSLLISNTAADAASGPQVYINNADAANDRVSIQNNLIAGGSDPAEDDQGVVYADEAATTIMQANTNPETDAGTVFASIVATEPNYLRLITDGTGTNAGDNSYVNNNTPDDPEDDIKTDAAGNARVRGGRVDLGAYESITRGPQTIGFTLAHRRHHRHRNRPCNATATSGLSVTYISDAPGVAAIGTNSDGNPVLRLLSEGSATITASQSGDTDDYLAAPNVTQTITVRTPVILRVATEDDAVNPGTTGGDGTTWASATTLSSALNTASIGDQIWIKTGTYTPATLAADATTATRRPTGNEFLHPRRSAASMAVLPAPKRLLTPPTTPAPATPTAYVMTHPTVLSGDLLGGNDLPRPGPDEDAAPYNDRPHRQQLAPWWTFAGANTTLDGLTITAGEGGGRTRSPNLR